MTYHPDNIDYTNDEPIAFVGTYSLNWDYHDADNPAETGWRCEASLTGGKLVVGARDAEGRWRDRSLALTLWQIEELFGAAEIKRMEDAAAERAEETAR